jgi:hypothetical protein
MRYKKIQDIIACLIGIVAIVFLFILLEWEVALTIFALAWSNNYQLIQLMKNKAIKSKNTFI